MRAVVCAGARGVERRLQNRAGEARRSPGHHQRDWERAQKIDQSNALAQTQYDAYKGAYDQAKANVDVGAASIDQAKAAVAQAQASLARVQRNLGYCTIKSPVNGVIIDRRVNIG